jgi:hypothetical protein
VRRRWPPGTAFVAAGAGGIVVLLARDTGAGCLCEGGIPTGTALMSAPMGFDASARHRFAPQQTEEFNHEGTKGTKVSRRSATAHSEPTRMTQTRHHFGKNIERNRNRRCK